MEKTIETKYDICGNDLIISRNDWRAYTTYNATLFNEIKGREWRKTSNGYVINSNLGYLHRYVMQFWYGKEMFDEMSKLNYVVDHLDNDRENCRLSNLEFLKKPNNTAKGQTFDIDSKKAKNHITLTIFKDFSTGHYQITIGCNDPLGCKDTNGCLRYITAIYFLYVDCDYAIVINDAENFLIEYEKAGRISMERNHAIDLRIDFSPIISSTEEEKKAAIIWRDGKPLLSLDNGLVCLDRIYYKEGWIPQ